MPSTKTTLGTCPTLFPVFLRDKDGLVTPPQQLPRIIPVEDGDSGAVHQLIVRPVINQNDPIWRNDGRRPGFRDARIEAAGLSLGRTGVFVASVQ